MTHKHFLFIALLICSFYSRSYAQISSSGQENSSRVITTAVPFLSLAPDSRSSAMGDVGVAISPDANSVFWNPSKLVFIENKMGFSLSYSPWLAKIINDMSLSYLSGYYKITKEQAIAISMKYFDLGEMQFTDDQNNPLGNFNPKEFAFDINYAQKLFENFSIGVSLRYINSNLTGHYVGTLGSLVDSKPANTIAVDISSFYKQSTKIGQLAFGANISNIGAKITYSNQENKDFIPINLRLGTTLKTDINPYNSITFGFDINKLLVPSPPVYQKDNNGVIQRDSNNKKIIEKGKDPDRNLLSGMFGSFNDAPYGFSEELQEIMLSIGAEYWYNNVFAARLGYFYENINKGNRKLFTIGAGFKYNVLGLDFSYLIPSKQEHPLAETLRFTLHFDFESISDESSVTD